MKSCFPAAPIFVGAFFINDGVVYGAKRRKPQPELTPRSHRLCGSKAILFDEGFPAGESKGAKSRGRSQGIGPAMRIWFYRRTRLGQEAIPHIRMGKYVRFDWEAVVEFYKSDSQ